MARIYVLTFTKGNNKGATMARRGRSFLGDDPATFFVTRTVMNFDPIFHLERVFYENLLASLRFVLKKYQAVLYAYVFMPSHIHALIGVTQGVLISALMRDFKKFTSTKTRQTLEAQGRNAWVERLRGNSSGRKGQVFKLWMNRLMTSFWLQGT